MVAASDRASVLERTFRPAERQVDLPWDRLTKWLRASGRNVADLAPRQFSGGVANLNYLLKVDGVDVVLRRPPSGTLAKGASDMAREWRVLRSLNAVYPLAPRGILFCDDISVVGAPFQLIEYRPGVGVGARVPAEWAEDRAVIPRLIDQLLDAMAGLHAVDPASAGLGDLGRPESFLDRQVAGWERRAAAAYDGHPVPEVAAVLSWLRQHVPADQRISLLHCDLKLDNLLVHPVSHKAVAVVDWDMATTGEPLFDLGVLLAYWVQWDDPAELRALEQVPSLEHGAPDRYTVARGYFDRAGLAERDMSFYFTLGRLRLAIAWQQLYVLHRTGAQSDPRYSTFSDIATAVLTWTADTLDESPI